MRKFSAVVLVLLIILIGGYTAYWFQKAGDFKAMLEQSIVNLNESEKPYLKDTPFIRYESIQPSGYPFAIQLNIVKPVINIPVLHYISVFARKPGLLETPEAKSTNAVMELAYGDSIAFKSNLMANSFSLILSGDTTIKTTVNNVPSKTVVSSAATPTTCILDIYNPNNMPWNIPQSFADTDAFAQSFRSIDCEISQHTSKLQSGEVLTTSEGLRFFAESEPKDSEHHKLALKFDLKNAKATPAYQDIINYYWQLYYTLAQTPQELRSPAMDIVQLGVQNDTIDIAYQGPVEKDALLNPDAALQFDINAFHIKNDIYDSSTESHVSVTNSGNTKNVSVVLHTGLLATAKYEEAYVKTLTYVINDLVKNPVLGTGGSFADMLVKLNNPEALAIAMVPPMHSMNKIATDIDIKASGDKDNFTKNNMLTIDAFNFTTNDGTYGLRTKGTGKVSIGTSPVGDIVFTCLTCDKTVDGIGDYAMTIDSLFAPTRIGQLHYVTKPLLESIKQFLHALDENTTGKNPQDVAIHLASDDKGRITLSGKQLLEVLTLYSTTVAQNITRPTPTAVVPAVPPMAPAVKPAVPTPHTVPPVRLPAKPAK